ncbi:hypothetical protein HY494_01775 [Candidatus Woesearchaeota archaeon]|nr:hypothetical protein [Candidatus Woesearchaeota archaeon]
MKKIAVAVVVVFALLFTIFTSADTDTAWPCSVDSDCQVLVQNGDTYTCNQDTLTCFLIETPQDSVPLDTVTDTATTTAPAVSAADEKITALEESLTGLENDLAALTSDLSLSKNEILTIQNQITALQTELANLQNNNQDLSSKTNTLSTGLAGLQQSLDSLQKTLSEGQTFGRVINVILMILLIGGVAGGIYYYINRTQKIINPEIVNYINNSIKQGKKLHQVKQELRKAGWMDSDIDKAYNETVKQNYRQYKSAQPEAKISEQRPVNRTSAQRSAPSMTYDLKKMIIIAVVGILVIVGALLVLRASTGQAIFLKKLVGGEQNGTGGEITYKIECTPPHLLNPAGDACCLDSDNSGVCDTTELQGVGLNARGECNDNRECKVGLYCVANKCASLDSLYTGEGDCSKLCSYYAIKMLTSDGENYNLKPKQGSYTGAGALEWKILPMPQHCKGEQPIVPINIIKKQTGQVVSEEVILLRKGEKSPVLTHPTISKLTFMLTVADVFESCPK